MILPQLTTFAVFLTFSPFIGVVGLNLGTKKFFRGKLFTDISSKKQLESEKFFPVSWFDQQKVNHFDPNDNRVWSQKYFINTWFYKKGAPVFISLGGEGSLSNYDVTASAIAEMGKQLDSILITVEHRFYGESHPTNDTSPENLRLLTSQQALADFANIITYLKNRYDLNDNKWIACGCSYAGNLAAWIRIRYPHLIYAAVASSAPVLAKFDFQEYYGKVGQVIRETSPLCYSVLQEAFSSIPYYLKADELENKLHSPYMQAMKKTFGLCEDLNTKDEWEVESFYASLVNYWASVAQYNELANGYVLGGLSVDYLCRVMVTPLNSTLPEVFKPSTAKNIEDNAVEVQTFINPSVKKLGRLILHLNKFYNQSCTQSSFRNFVDLLKEEEWTSLGATYSMRQWIWQTCTEFAYYQTLNSYMQPFGHGLTESNYVKTCQLVYGEMYDELYTRNYVDYTNGIYGGKAYSGSRIIYVNGDKDPWSTLGFNEQHETNNENFVIKLKGRSHCSNAYQTLTGDTQDLIDSKKMIVEKLKFWLRPLY